jgi:gliding motility-associated-like protein
VAGSFVYSLVSVQETSGTTCINTVSGSSTVTINPLPTVVVTAPPVICSPGSIDLTNPSLTSAGSTANLSYTRWNNAAATSVLANANAVTATGVYYIKGTIPATGCALTKPVTVTINSLPIVVITSPAIVCAPLSIDLTASAVTSGSSPGLTYSYWSNATNTNPLSTASAVNTSGVYYIKGTIAATGCAQSQPVTVTVNPLPNGILQNPSVNYICDGSSLVLNASNAFAYQWYRDQQPVSGAVADNYAATVAGNYTVRFISKDGCIKDATNSLTLTLLTKPAVQYTMSSTCAGSPISFTNGSVIASSGNINWQWDFGDGGVSNSSSPVYTYPNGGNYNITLTANNTSCSSLTEKIVTAYTIESPRIPTRYADVNAVGGVPIQLNSRNAGNVYLWQPSTGLNNPSLQFPTATLDKDVTYTIMINSNAGCTVTDTVLVKVALDGYIYVGQGFTPNGDGMNDKCYPITVGIRSLTYFKIFNRWGNLVFQTNDTTPQNGWDGKYNGKIQPAGTYQWVAEAIDGSGNIIKRTGAVLLIN